MRIYGLDFTSAPSKRKPLTLAVCTFDGTALQLKQLERWTKFTGLEAFLQREGPFVVGMDFAFGQPLQLLQNLNFPLNWEDYVDLIAAMGKQDWVSCIDRYMQARPLGDKLHFRTVDRLAGAQSPMTMYFIPVGRMFFEGARRLLASDLSILPNRPTADNRIAVEVYPALVARKFVGRNSAYKSDNPDKQTDIAYEKRIAILEGLLTHGADIYGLNVHVLPEHFSQLVADPTGDLLDALLGAVQAAWAYTQRANHYGIPPNISPAEGWIVDPELLENYHA